MPNRVIHESCRSSPTLAKLSDFAERLFWRLTTVADDWGRFPADTLFLRSECFPVSGGVTPAKIAASFTELQRVGLVRAYNFRDRTYAYFTTWETYQRRRAEKSKYPDPPPLTSDSNGGQPLTNAAVNENENANDIRERETAVSGATARGGKPKAGKEPDPQCPDCIRVLKELYAITGRKFRLNGKPTYPHLHSRHEEAGVDICLAVVRQQWDRKKGTKWEEFVRPRTLFGPDNFVEYRAEAEAAQENGNG